MRPLMRRVKSSVCPAKSWSCLQKIVLLTINGVSELNESWKEYRIVGKVVCLISRSARGPGKIFVVKV